jgi:hypothetical protein
MLSALTIPSLNRHFTPPTRPVRRDAPAPNFDCDYDCDYVFAAQAPAVAVASIYFPLLTVI